MLLAVALAAASPPAPPEHMLLGDRVAVYATATDTVALAHVASVDGRFLEVAVVGREGDRVQVTNDATGYSCVGSPSAFSDGNITFWVRADDVTRVVPVAAEGAEANWSWSVRAGTPVMPGSSGGVAAIADGVSVEAAGIAVSESFPATVQAPESTFWPAHEWIAGNHTLTLGAGRITLTDGAGFTPAARSSGGAPVNLDIATACGSVLASVPAGWLGGAPADGGGGDTMGDDYAPVKGAPVRPRFQLRRGSPLFWPGGASAGVLTRDRQVEGLREDGDRRCWAQPGLFAAQSVTFGPHDTLCVAAADAHRVTPR